MYRVIRRLHREKEGAPIWPRHIVAAFEGEVSHRSVYRALVALVALGLVERSKVRGYSTTS